MEGAPSDDQASIRAFDVIVGPLVSSLEGVIADVDAVRDRYQWIPAADSPAMAELEDEGRLSGVWRTRPVSQAHQHAGFLLLAAEDHAAGMCRLLRLPEASIFAHIPMARAALEACALSLRLSAPRISADQRVARYMTESLYSDAQVAKFSPAIELDRLKRKELVLEQTAAVGLTAIKAKKGAVRAIGEPRPSFTELVTDLFRNDPSDDIDLGRVLYVLYSAVSHGTAFGLRSSIRSLAAGDPRSAGWAPQEGHQVAGVVVDADEVAFVVGVLTHGYLIAAGALVTLMGWDSADRRQHSMNALKLVRRAFTDAEARRGAR